MQRTNKFPNKSLIYVKTSAKKHLGYAKHSIFGAQRILCFVYCKIKQPTVNNTMSLKAEVLAGIESFRRRGLKEFTLAEFWDAMHENLHGKKPSVSNALSTLAKQPNAPVLLKPGNKGYSIVGVASPLQRKKVVASASQPTTLNTLMSPHWP